MLNDILAAFGLNGKDYHTEKFGAGLINQTWKIQHPLNGEAFILQQINKSVFKSPVRIAENTSKTGIYLAAHQPDYLFISSLPTLNNEYVVSYRNGEYYRLMPFVKDSVTLNTVQTRDQAFEAARQFARFTSVLTDFDIRQLNYTIVNFHNLSYRFFQFERALETASPERRDKAKQAIQQALMNRDIVNDYEEIVARSILPLRVMHHDTKINNILFDHMHKGICVIDLDTVMPGYFISDIGDMMRTYLSPCNEEEEDLDKISIREDFFTAIAEGYFLEMGSILTSNEKRLFYYAGKFMMYMQAIRFLTDYLNNDIYYQARHPDHNLNRANNQFTLLELYKDAETRFQSIIAQIK